MVGKGLVEGEDAVSPEFASEPCPWRVGGRDDLAQLVEDEAPVGAQLDVQPAVADLADGTERFQAGSPIAESKPASGSPVELEVLASGRAILSDEAELHYRFRDSRLHGEWFAPSADLLAEIEDWQDRPPQFKGEAA